MKPLRPQLRGLIFKLTLFYVLLSLPCLILVESGILLIEFNRFMHGVEHGSLTNATQRAATALARDWPKSSVDAAQSLANWTESLVLRLQRPRGGLLEHESYILIELASDPVAAAVLSPDGHVLARAPSSADWRLELPREGSPLLLQALRQPHPRLLASASGAYRIRRAIAPVRDADGTLRGFLLVELRLPVPWRRFLLDLSLEWPIVLGYLLIFGIASSFFLAAWVTRRLNRVARAATAWSSGNFSDRIDDPSRDELGRLSQLLDEMALELKALMRSRAQLATLAERQRLARDLHDTVKQKAFALNMQLAGARRQLAGHPAGERVAQAEMLCHQIQHELAHILDEMRASDAQLPLAQRLRMRAEQWSQGSGVSLELELTNIPPLTDTHADTIMRIVDEALANVLRHSGADRVRVSLTSHDNTTQLSIADNGQGANPDARRGMGLDNMRARAQSLPAGTFEFVSDIDRGCRVNVTFQTRLDDKT